MRFWDSSALITIHVEHEHTGRARALYEADPDVVAWTLTDVEMRSALRRLEREGALLGPAVNEAIKRVEGLWDSVYTVQLTDGLKARAKRLLAAHVLRAADALQLAAALVAAGDDADGFEFVCLDQRLAAAAAREGFDVVLG
jgi:predicted nucleic acid-binding protein